MKKVFINEIPDFKRRKFVDDLMTISILFLITAGLAYFITSKEEMKYLPWALIILLFFYTLVVGFSSGIGYHVYFLAIENEQVTLEYLVSQPFFRLKPLKIIFSIEGTTTRTQKNLFFYVLDKDKREIFQVDLSKHKGFDALWNEVIAYYQKHKKAN